LQIATSMTQTKEERLWQAATVGDLETVKVLAEDPEVNVNWDDPEIGRTPFYRACGHGQAAVVRYLLSHPRLDPNIPERTMTASPYFVACQEGKVEVVGLLLADLRVNVSRARGDKVTPFFMAAQEGRVEVVSLLLVDPRGDPTVGNDENVTPFSIACQNGHLRIIHLLLEDWRVDPNRPKINNSSPLYYATQNGHLDVVRHLLASWRPINTGLKSDWNNRKAAEQGRRIIPRGSNDSDETFARKKTNGPLCSDIIDEYEQDPEAVRQRLRRLPGVREYFIGHTFALVVFFSDGFLQLGPDAPSPTERFLRVNSRLPLELQMLLCNRLFGSSHSIILSKDSEPGFRWLARLSTWAEESR